MVERARTKSTPGTKSLKKLPKGQFLDSCRQKTGFLVPVGQTKVRTETPLERRTFLPAWQQPMRGFKVGNNRGDKTPLELFSPAFSDWRQDLVTCSARQRKFEKRGNRVSRRSHTAASAGSASFGEQSFR
jgi:hypothetical protein